MKSVETEQRPLPVNPIVANGYLIYGEAKPTGVDKQYEAWYWIAQPDPDLEHLNTIVYKRFGPNLYPGRGLAIVCALEWGREVVKDKETGAYFAFPPILETVDGFIIRRSSILEENIFYPLIEAERHFPDGRHILQHRKITGLGEFVTEEETMNAVKRIHISSIKLSDDGKGAIIDCSFS